MHHISYPVKRSNEVINFNQSITISTELKKTSFRNLFEGNQIKTKFINKYKLLIIEFCIKVRMQQGGFLLLAI